METSKDWLLALEVAPFNFLASLINGNVLEKFYMNVTDVHDFYFF